MATLSPAQADENVARIRSSLSPAKADENVARIRALFATYGTSDYVGEKVSQQAHALQAAAHAGA